MFHRLRPEYMPEDDIKRVNRPNSWVYFSTALKEAGDAVDKALKESADEELTEKIGAYRRALAEVTQTGFGRTALERTKIKALEDRLTKVTGDLNKGLLAHDRSLVRSTLLRLSFPE